MSASKNNSCAVWRALAALALLIMTSHAGAAEVAEASGKPTVRFLMQNVQNYFVGGEQQRSRYTIRPKRESEREAVADTIASAKPEIVGLVEIGGPLALDDLAQRLSARGVEFPHRKVLARDGEDRALALLSRHPIVKDVSRADYPLYGTHKRNMLRGILDVTVKVPDGRKFRILGAHLKAHTGDSDAYADKLRSQEAHTLALYIQDILKKSPNKPLLLFGDMNDNPTDDTIRILSDGVSKRSAMVRVDAKDAAGEGWTHYYAIGGSYLVYDQIYVNPALGKRMGKKAENGVEQSTPRGSDHRAVWCDLR